MVVNSAVGRAHGGDDLPRLKPCVASGICERVEGGGRSDSLLRETTRRPEQALIAFSLLTVCYPRRQPGHIRRPTQRRIPGGGPEGRGPRIEEVPQPCRVDR